MLTNNSVGQNWPRFFCVYIKHKWIQNRAGHVIDNNIRLGGKAFIGYERKEGVFVEAGYTLVPKINQLNASGLGLSLGYRF